MTKNIIDIALHETKNYIKKLNTSKVFKNITDSYIHKHNKGFHVGFTYNSTDAKGLFSVFPHWYGFELEIDINPEFNRNREVHLINLDNRLNTEIKNLLDKKSRYRKIKNTHNELIASSSIEVPLQPNGKLVSTEHELGAAEFSSRLLDAILMDLKEKIERKKKHQHIIKSVWSSIHYPQTSLKHIEIEYFKKILCVYMSSIQMHVRKLFKNDEVYVLYKEKEWISGYEDYREKEKNGAQATDGLSRVENCILSYIQKKFNAFSIQLHKEDFVFTIAKSFRDVSLKKNAVQNPKNQMQKWETDYRNFVERHPEFNLLLNLRNEIIYALDDKEPSVQLIMKYIFNTHTQQIIDEYNSLIKQKNEINKLHNNNSYRTGQDFPALQVAFPHVAFEVRTERDLGLSFALKEDIYNDVLVRVHNDAYNLTLSKEENLENIG